MAYLSYAKLCMRCNMFCILNDNFLCKISYEMHALRSPTISQLQSLKVMV